MRGIAPPPPIIYLQPHRPLLSCCPLPYPSSIRPYLTPSLLQLLPLPPPATHSLFQKRRMTDPTSILIQPFSYEKAKKITSITALNQGFNGRSFLFKIRMAVSSSPVPSHARIEQGEKFHRNRFARFPFEKLTKTRSQALPSDKHK